MGQLTNQYISSSYQGLLKMTDSTNGLTNQLQTVQTGDGDNSPLQMSLTEVNISGSFLINNVPITNGTNGTSGTSGINGTSGTSGVSGTNGSSGTSGSSGSNGSSGTSGLSGATGTSGTSGTSGSSGSNGSSGTSGSSGATGTSGTSGTSGINGTSGTSGINGTNGTSGSNGSSGTSGTAGTSGTSPIVDIGQFATTGSNQFIGNQGIFGNVSITGSLNAYSASITYLQTVYETASVIYSSGSNQFGDASNDIQLLWGKVVLPTGPLEITGSVDITGQYLVNGVPFTGGSNGTSGTSGSSGSNGSSGTSGINGTNGTSGSNGSSGTSGTSGSSGSNGSSGTSGIDGTNGTSGTSGSNGSSGTSGSDGSSGTSGTSGVGTNGTSGTSGTSGANGISAGRTYYFNQSQTSDVSGYKVLSDEPTTGATQTVTTSIPGNTNDVLISSYITAELGFPVIPSGVQRFYLQFKKPAENDNIQAYVTLQLANSTGGTIGSLLTASPKVIGWNGTDPDEVIVEYVFPTTNIDPTNRMIVKIYANNDDSTTHSLNYLTENGDYSFVITSVGLVAGSSGTSGTSGINGTNGTSGTSGISGTDGSSGTSGTSGVSGTNGSSGTSGTSGTSPIIDTSQFATTGSNIFIGNQTITGSVNVTAGITGSLEGTASYATNALTASFALNGGGGGSVDTGSFATTGSNIFRGNQVISGSLIGNTLNNGMIFIGSEAYESGSIKASISASAAISQSNLFFGGLTGPEPFRSGSIVVSGSNNILMGGPRPSSLNLGTYGYVGGNLNIISGIQTLTTASVLRPTMTQNLNFGNLTMAFTTSSLTTPNINANIIPGGTLTINHQSGSANFQNNYIAGGLISNQNNITAVTIPVITGNNILGTTTLNHISSSITFNNNYGGGTMTVTNLYSGSFGAATNPIAVSNNTFGGTANGIWVSGSNSSAVLRQISGSLMGGLNTAVTSSQVNSNNGNLLATAIWGQNLIVSASNATTAGGSAFFGRFNDASTLHTSQEIVFAVGTGTAVGTRRTGFYIDSGSNVVVSGSFRTIGNTTITGSVTLSGSAGPELIVIGDTVMTGSLSFETGSIGSGLTGSIRVSGSVYGAVNNLSITSNTASLNLVNGNFYTLTLPTGVNTFVSASNVQPGQTVNLVVSNGGTGTISFSNNVKQPSGSFYTATTGSGVIDIVTLMSVDSNNLYMNNIKNLI